MMRTTKKPQPRVHSPRRADAAQFGARDWAMASAIADRGLPGWDMDLVGWVCCACREHGNHDLIMEIFSMGADARRRLDGALGRLHGCHVVGSLTPDEKQRAIDEVYAELQRAGRASWVGDMLTMTRDELAAARRRRRHRCPTPDVRNEQAR